MNIDNNFINEDSLSEDIISNDNSNNSNIKKILIIISSIIFFIILVIVYARYGATSGIKVKEYKITNDSLPLSFHGIKVAHISDIHFGSTTSLDDLKLVVKTVNNTKPDIVVFTGDFLENEIDNDTTLKIIDILSGISASIDKYAISGESDYNLDLFNNIFSSSSFILLNNSSDTIYYNGDVPIFISNTDIPDNDLFSIYLLHEPDKFDELSNTYDLVLAGHSHNGQINIPGIKNLLLKSGARKYYNGYYDINNTKLYISSGIGTDNFKFRFFNKPSINLYRLTNH